MALSLDQAISYLQQKVGEFRALPGRIVRTRQLADTVARVAAERGMVEEAAKASAANTALLAQLSGVNSLLRKLDDLETKLQALGIRIAASVYLPDGLGALPAIPVALAAIAVTLAAGIGYALRAYSAQEQLVNALATGVLTPEEYRRATSGGVLGPLGRALPWIAAGTVAFLLWSRRGNR